jgi:sialate O-acetylesterase
MDPWRTRVADVLITEGPGDFRIYQQDESGVADIEVAGTWEKVPGGSDFKVMIRVVSETDNSPVPPTIKLATVDHLGDGTWRHMLRGVPAGGLYEIRTHLSWTGDDGMAAGRAGDSRQHIGVGDLWLMAGQSNASGSGRGVADDPPELGIHVLRNDERWDVAAHPLNAARRTDHPNRDAGLGVSPWLSAAKIMRRRLGYPIGLVQTAKGGSGLREWHVGEDPHASLWHNMIFCTHLAGGRVRGMFWHQGCSDGGNFMLADPRIYKDRWAAFIGLLRKEVGDIPIITAQINRWTDIDHPPELRQSFSIIRDQQRLAAELPGVCVVPTLDLPLSDGIHNSATGNVTLGQRMGRAALGFVYGSPLPWAAPTVRRARLAEKDRIVVLEFDDVTSHLMFLGFGTSEFIVADNTGPVEIKAAVAEADEVRLTLARAIEGKAVIHGGYDVDPVWTLRDCETNLPALAFMDVPVEK